MGPTLNHPDGKPRLFHLVVGNPPWGQQTAISEAATRWVEDEARQSSSDQREPWPTSYQSVGPLFLPKAAKHVTRRGYVSLMQSSGVLLNDVGTARAFRDRFFKEFRVEEIVNLSPLRYVLFSGESKATSPPCVITMRQGGDDLAEDIAYICPKPIKTVEDQYRLLVGPYDCHLVRPEEAADGGALIALIWGGRRLQL